MVEAMSKKEKLARGSAVIKVMKVIPRPGHFLQTYLDVYKMPRKPKLPLPKGLPEGLMEMPHLDLRNANFNLEPTCAKIPLPSPFKPPDSGKSADPCGLGDISSFFEKVDPTKLGLPEGHPFIKYFGYREWAKIVYPPDDGNLAEHFNILLGLIMTMAKDPENANFPDCEAFPCVQFLRTVKTPDGEVPFNIASFVEFLNYICLKIVEDA